MTRLISCIMLGFVLLTASLGESAQPSSAEVRAFFTAALTSDLLTLDKMLKNGFDVNTSAGDGNNFVKGTTALHVAAAYDQTGAINALLAAGADIEAQNVEGKTPMHHAARFGRTIAVNALLNAGANINAEDNAGRTPLHEAVLHSKTGVEALLNAGAYIYAEDDDDQTPLQYGQKNASSAKGLSTLDRYIKGMLHAFFGAAVDGDLDKLATLMKNGFDVNTPAGDGDNFVKGTTALHIAAAYDQTGAINALLAAGADIEAQNVEGKTPMHHAARFGRTIAVNALLNAGANINAEDNAGRTPLHEAVLHSKTGVEALLNAGAYIYAEDDDDQTPLQYGQKNASSAKGLSTLDRYIKGMLHAFFGAAVDGDLDKLATLMKNGFDVNTPAGDGDNFVKGTTALHIAAAYDQTGAINALLAAGADIEAQDVEGKTPLLLAARFGRAAAINSLAAAGANIYAEDNDGKTAQQIAQDNGHARLATRLYEYIQALAKRLRDAILAGDLTTVKRRLQKGDDVNATAPQTGLDPLDHSMLHHAVSVKNPSMDIINVLLQAGADVDAQDQLGWTPLHYAATQEHTAVIAALIKGGADTDVQNNDGWTTLHEAARRNLPKSIDALLKAGADTEGKDKSGWTALHHAASQGRAASITALLAAGVAIEAADNNSRTPLHEAARSGHTAIVDTLLEAGADINAKDKSGKTAQQIAQDSGHAKLATHLRDYAQELLTKLHKAVIAGDLAAVTLLLQEGTDVNIRDLQGETALHHAAKKPNTAIINALIKAGADVDAQNKFGSAPLHNAAVHANADTVRRLLQAQADPDVKDQNDWVPLHYASGREDMGMIQALLAAGADVNAKNDRDKTALHFIASGSTGDTDIATILLEAGANVYLEDSSGDTALQAAQGVLGGRGSLVALLRDHMREQAELRQAILDADLDPLKRLLRNGVKLYAPDADGYTALHYAVVNDSLAAAELMLAYDRDRNGMQVNLLNRPDEDGNTALHLAVQAGDMALVELLVGYEPGVLLRNIGAEIRPGDLDKEAGIPNDVGKTPQRLAQEAGHTSIMQALNGSAALQTKREFFLAVCESDDPTDVESWLDAWPSVETRNSIHVNTPLHTALYCGKTNVAQWLLTQGASTEARNAFGETPLHVAALMGDAGIVTALLDEDADVNVERPDGTTPLHYAAMLGDSDVVTQLLQAGADPAITDSDGNTAADLATDWGYVEVAEIITDWS